MGFGPGLITGTFFSVLHVLLLALIAFKLFAFVDAMIRPGPAYEAAGKLTKVAWPIFLGLAVLVDVKWGGVTSILTILGTIAAIVYVVDVRPALRELTGKNNPKGGQTGPYGPW
jgi:hypothetical protein